MPPRARSLQDGHDLLAGVAIGVAVEPPDPQSGEWGKLRFAEDVLRECMAVLAYVADAEERHGFPRSAEHYRALWSQAAAAAPQLHRLAIGAETLPTSLLDQVRLGTDRLSNAVEALARVARPADFDGR